MPIEHASPTHNGRVSDVVSAYWKHYELSTSADRDDRLRADEFYWAWEQIDARICDLAPADAIALLILLADAAPSDPALVYLGAGPIEDLLVTRAAEVVDAIDDAARANAKFRDALTAAWYDEHVPPEIAHRLRRFGEPT